VDMVDVTAPEEKKKRKPRGPRKTANDRLRELVEVKRCELEKLSAKHKAVCDEQTKLWAAVGASRAELESLERACVSPAPASTVEQAIQDEGLDDDGYVVEAT